MTLCRSKCYLSVFSCNVSLWHNIFLLLIHLQVSPIEYGHVLLVPKLLDCKPQQIDEASFRLALNFAVEAQNLSFRVGYNSLGAFATINHLHFQVILSYIGRRLSFCIKQKMINFLTLKKNFSFTIECNFIFLWHSEDCP